MLPSTTSHLACVACVCVCVVVTQPTNQAAWCGFLVYTDQREIYLVVECYNDFRYVAQRPLNDFITDDDSDLLVR